MARKHYKTEEIIHKLREAEVLIGQGYTTKEAAKELGAVNKPTIAGGKNTAGWKNARPGA